MEFPPTNTHQDDNLQDDTQPMIREETPRAFQEQRNMPRSRQPRALISAISGVLAVILIVTAFAILLVARKTTPNRPASGTILSTPTLAETILPGTPPPNRSPTPGTTPNGSATADLPYASSATVSLLSPIVTFTTGAIGDGMDVSITSSSYITIATDGTGEIAGFYKTFQVQAGDANEVNNDQIPAQLANGEYGVPENCETDPYYVNLAHKNASLALHQELLDDVAATQDNEIVLIDPSDSTLVPVQYDDSTITCSPAPGYQSSTTFNYTISMAASMQATLYDASTACDYRTEEAMTAAPPNYEVETTNCTPGRVGTGGIQVVSATSFICLCGETGLYDWKWTSQIAQNLAEQIAEKARLTHLISFVPIRVLPLTFIITGYNSVSQVGVIFPSIPKTLCSRSMTVGRIFSPQDRHARFHKKIS